MPTIPAVITEIRRELKKYDKPEFKIDAQQFHKEKVKRRYVLKVGICRKVSAQFFRKVNVHNKEGILSLCEILCTSGRDCEKLIGFDWTYRIRDRFEKKDYERFKKWLGDYVENWGACDHFSCSILGEFLLLYPEFIRESEKWAKGKKRWFKRAAAVSLIPSLNEGLKLSEAFRIADIMLLDDDDMVQKGYGWLLKVAADKYRKEVFEFVMQRKDRMPRTALRYAIEKMPSELKRKAMVK